MSAVVNASRPADVHTGEAVENHHSRLFVDPLLAEHRDHHDEYDEAAAEGGCGGECGCGHQHPPDLNAPREGPRAMTTGGIPKV
jgi:hypothetical protein